MSVPDTLVRLSVPARAEYVALARGVLAAAAGRAGLTLDAGDDLALAVAEMSAALLEAGGRGQLTIAVVDSPVGIRVEASADGISGEWPPAGWESTAAAMILEALVDDVAFARSNGSSSISVSKTATGID